jgi:GAF domain-containing protein
MSEHLDRAPGDVRARLHRLLFVTNGLDEFLEQLAVLAADVVEGDSECGITLIREGQPVTVAASGERTAKLDEIQYGNGDGPCLHAARTGEVVLVNDLSTDTRWPAYRDQVEGQGLHSTVALPLELGDDERGALNFYVFERRHRFTKGELRVLSQFSAEATRALDLALRHDEQSRQTGHLHAAMATRRVIDQALGIVMAQNRCSSDEAFRILRRASNNRNLKMQLLAEDLIRTMTGTEPSRDTHWHP